MCERPNWKFFSYFSFRITSYNVCYTKLLRLVSFFAKEDKMGIDEFEKLMNEVKEDLDKEK